MPIVEYHPGLFEKLQRMVSQLKRNMNLSHRPFVDYYYASRDWCKLYLYLSDSGEVVGTLGRELLRFEYQGREFTIRIGSNWFSLRPGIGGQLTRFSAQSNPGTFGMMLMASQTAVSVLRHLDWVPIPGLTAYFLNGPCSLFPGKSRWKPAANWLVRQILGKPIPSFAARISADVRARISVSEEHSYSPDLLPRRSPFPFRFAPPIEYLDWRYNLALSFVRYRLFRILASGTTVGYVILNESPAHLIVAQCDGEQAAALAYGVLLAILAVAAGDQRPRSVFLSCCHGEMRRIFEEFGFRPRPRRPEIPFAFRDVPPQIERPLDSSRWLVNYDWCDNGLQAPFLDQQA